MDDLKERWFVTTLCVAAALFFTGALLFSMFTYVDVMQARQGVELRDPVMAADELDNGSLLVSFSIVVHNPSGMDLQVQSMSWTVRAENTTDSPASYLPVVSLFNSTSDDIVFGGETDRTVQYEAIVSDEAKLEALRQLAAYISSTGDDTALSTIKYTHDFRLIAWAGGLDHDYQYYKELYLNDIVRVERTFYGSEYE